MSDPLAAVSDALPVPQSWKPWVIGALVVVAVIWLAKRAGPKSTELPTSSISNAGNAQSSVGAMSSRPSADSSQPVA